MRKLILLLTSVVLITMCFAGCYDRGKDAGGELIERFTCVMSDKSGSRYEIWKDNKTGVLYLSLVDGYRRSMTVLLDEDGKPLLDEEGRR